jgi:dihydroflavonol-4-reductase
MRIFVTGGTGLLGNTVLRQLTEQGHELISLVRGEPDQQVFAGIETEFAAGDLSDRDVIDAAVKRCDAVIHSAGLLHIGWKRLEDSMRVNFEGTRTVAQACLKHDCKLVHVGSVNVMAIGSRDQPSDEDTPLDSHGGQLPCPYVVSKRAGCDEVRRLVGDGLRAVLVHPGYMLGPWDWKPSSGRMMLEVARNWTPLAPTGGCSICDPRDVAQGTIAALHQGGDAGRDYILAGANWTYLKLWTEMTKRIGKRPPIKTMGPVIRWTAGRCGDLIATLTGKEPDINSAGIRITGMFHWHDSSRAKSELGYQNRDPHESLDDLMQWINEHHLKR